MGLNEKCPKPRSKYRKGQVVWTYVLGDVVQNSCVVQCKITGFSKSYDNKPLCIMECLEPRFSTREIGREYAMVFPTEHDALHALIAWLEDRELSEWHHLDILIERILASKSELQALNAHIRYMRTLEDATCSKVL